MFKVGKWQGEEVKLTYSVIVARYKGDLVLVNHNKRDTWEIPGGHIEDNETALEAAKRELYEETGAIKFNIKEVCTYFVNKDGFEDYGKLFIADIEVLEDIPEGSEIKQKKIFKKLPENLTYKEIQPKLLKLALT